MAKKPVQSAPPTTVKSTSNRPISGSVSTPPSAKPQISSLTSRSSVPDVLVHVWQKYVNDTPTRTVLLDVFMGFLVLVGAVQFLYCILAGNYPFNAFLSGFGAAVGQFVLTASLRMQTSERPPATASASVKKSGNDTSEDGKGSRISSERAFADYVLGSLILHAFCVNFIN